MPAKVPEYSLPTVAPAGLSDVRQQTPYHLMQKSVMGADEQVAFGQKLMAAGGELGRMALQDQIQQNESDAKTWDANAVRAMDAQLYGSTDAEGKFTPGYTQQKGDAAVKGAGGVNEELRKIAQDAIDSAPNDAVRRMLVGALGHRLEAYQTAVNKHASGEQLNYNLDSSKLRQQAAGDGATKAFDPLIDGKQVIYNPADAENPQRSLYQQQLGTAQSEMRAQAQHLGMTDADAALYVKNGMEKLYAQTALHLANIGQTQQAKDYLDRLTTTDAISQQTADKLKDTISPDLTADKVLSYTDKLGDTVKGEKEQLAQIRGDFEAGRLDGRERQMAEARVRSWAREAEANENKWEAQAVGKAQDYFINNPGKTILDLKAENPALYRSLAAKGHLAAMDSFASREARPKSDPIVQHNIDRYFGTGGDLDVTRMSDKDWLLLRGKLSEQDWRHYDRERSNAINGTVSSKDDPGNLNLQGYTAALNSRLAGIKVDPKNMKSDADKAYLGAVNQYAREWVLRDQQAQGKRFNQEEVGKSLDRLFAQDVTFRNTFLGFNTGTSTQRLLTVKPGDIPKEAYEGIKKTLPAGATDQDILLQYWRLHGKH